MAAPLHIEPLFSAGEIAARIEALAERIGRFYQDSGSTLLCVNEGARRFADALAAGLSVRGVRLERLAVRAHRSTGTALGAIAIEPFAAESVTGRDVLVVDDIADEGVTLRAILEIVALAAPRSARTAVLIHKPAARREPVPLDYVGFRVERGWLVGFGIDVDGAYRDLDWIGVLVDERF